MNGIMNDDRLTIVREYEFNNPLFQKIDSLIDNSKRNCHIKYFHTFDHICECDLSFTNIGNNETVNFTIFDKNMGLFELNKNLTIARGNGFMFNQINKLRTKIYSNHSHVNIHYHLRSGSPPLYRQFFIKISQKRDYIQFFCNDRRNLFHFACHQWYSYNNPRILT